MGHINAKGLDLLNKTDGNGMRFLRGVSDCDVCAIGKRTQRAHPKKANLLRDIRDCTSRIDLNSNYEHIIEITQLVGADLAEI